MDEATLEDQIAGARAYEALHVPAVFGQWCRESAPDVEWQEATAESLPYPDRSFDAVVSQFGLMFFSDRPQALREMVRGLKPGHRRG